MGRAVDRAVHDGELGAEEVGGRERCCRRVRGWRKGEGGSQEVCEEKEQEQEQQEERRKGACWRTLKEDELDSEPCFLPRSVFGLGHSHLHRGTGLRTLR